MKRRTFLTSTAAATGILSSTAGCLSSADGGSSNLMLGSLADRPAVDSGFFERRSSVQRVFLETETGVKYGVTDDTSDWVRLPVGGAVEAPSASELADGELAIAYDNGFELRARKTDGTTVSESIGSGGGGSVAGSDGQIQFNDAGSFGASQDLVWNGSRLGVGLTQTRPELRIGDDSAVRYGVRPLMIAHEDAAARFERLGDPQNGPGIFFVRSNNGSIQKSWFFGTFNVDNSRKDAFTINDYGTADSGTTPNGGNPQFHISQESDGGHVGINTGFPNHQLDVDGDARISEETYFEDFIELQSTAEPAAPSTDDVRVWNDGSALKVKFDDGSTQTLASK